MNLSFFNTGFLYLLPLSLLPVVIHLFFRRKPRRLAFSDLRFIKQASKNVTPRKKLQQWLLLLIRCLVLLFLCLAFARPVGYLGGSKQENRNKNILILVDASYSMGLNESGKSRFDASKNLAVSLVERLLPQKQRSAGKQVGVIVFSNVVEQYAALTNDADSLKKFILEADQSFNPTDIVPPFKLAYEMLSAQPDTSRTIIVITDMAGHLTAGSNAPLQDSIEKYNPGIQVVFIDAGAQNPDDFENAAVEKVSLLEDPLRFNVEIENFAESQKSTPLNLFINGSNVYDNAIKLEAKKAAGYEINFIQKQENSGEVHGEARVQEDALRVDDSCYFSFPVKTQEKVLIVDGDPKFGFGVNSESYYLNSVLSGRDNDRFSTRVCGVEEFEGESNIEKYGCLILCNAAEISDKSVDLIAKFADSPERKNVLLFLGAKVQPDKYPGLLNENMGIVQEARRFPAANTNTGNVFSDISSFELDKIIVSGYFKLNTAFSTVLLELDNGDPLLIEKTMNNSRLFIFASTADREWTNLPSKPFFPYFIRALVESSPQGAEKKETFIYAVGQTLKYTPDFAFSSGRFILPGGDTAPAKILPKEASREIQLDKAVKPGIYELQVFTNSRTVTKYFAVNLQNIAQESNLEKISTGGLSKKFPKARVAFLKNDKDTEQKVFTIIEGKELSRGFFILILFLLLLEVILANIKI